MVISAEKRDHDTPDPTAAPTPASSLCNFSSFPILKTWGHRKLLRCASVNSNGHPIRSPPIHHHDDDVSPWNLRRRPPPARDPSLSPPHPHSPPPAAARTTVTLRSTKVAEKKKKKERPRFSISLSVREIDEDIYALTGSRARRRPRKRPRSIQKQLDALFPGSWLTEITTDTYRVPE